MKIVLRTAVFAALVSTSPAQGLVVFANTPTTLVSAGSMGQNAPISGPPGSYYFGLLMAPPGTLDPAQFSFAGVYATNSGVVGRIGSGSYVPTVVGWLPLESKSYLVAGWSSSLGPTWSQGWLSGQFDSSGYFGISSVGTGAAGGPSGGVPAPALPLFGPSGSGFISAGFNLDPVPEPSVTALLALGAAAFALQLRGKMDLKRPND